MTLEYPTVREVLLDKVKLYKCIGEEESVLDFVAARATSAGQTLQLRDWSARVYTQFTLAHALGTCPYRWDSGYDMARVMSMTLHAVRVLIVDAPWMPDGAVPGREKAVLVRQAVSGYLSDDVQKEDPLLKAIAVSGFALACRETEAQWELVFGPGGTFDPMDERVVMELKRGSFSTTSHYRESSDGEWRRYDERMAHEEEKSPSFLTS